MTIKIKTNYKNTKQANENIIKNKTTTATDNNNSNNEENEEEEEEVIIDKVETYEVNIINKLVVSKEWIDYIYNYPMKKALNEIKTYLTNDDEIRVKSIKLLKNIFFYMIIGLLIVLLSCAAVIINSATSLNGDPRFIEYEGRKHNAKGLNSSKNKKIYMNKNGSNEDTIIISCKKCYHKIKNGNILAITSGSFAIFFFIIFVFCLSLAISCEQKK